MIRVDGFYTQNQIEIYQFQFYRTRDWTGALEKSVKIADPGGFFFTHP